MFFPDLSADQVTAAVEARWDLSGPFPVPKPGWMRCRCGSTVIQPRYWKWHRRDTPTVPWRCDLHVKCCVCSEAWTYGIAVPDGYWHRWSRLHQSQIVPWRDVRDYLEAHGG